MQIMKNRVYTVRIKHHGYNRHRNYALIPINFIEAVQILYGWCFVGRQKNSKHPDVRIPVQQTFGSIMAVRECSRLYWYTVV